MIKSRGSHTAGLDDVDHEEGNRADASSVGDGESLPFELQVLEAALGEICRWGRRRAAQGLHRGMLMPQGLFNCLRLHHTCSY